MLCRCAVQTLKSCKLLIKSHVPCAHNRWFGQEYSTLANETYTEMKRLEVFSECSSKFVTFDFDASSNDNAVIGEVQRWLARQTGPVLLVLDNVQRQPQLDDVLYDTNMKDRSFVLVTSRRRDLRVSRTLGVLGLYDMPTMGYSDALELFRWHSQDPGTAGVLKTRSLKVTCI
jgi:hypothetical protein